MDEPPAGSPDPSEAEQFRQFLRQSGRADALAEFDRAAGIYGPGVPTLSIIRMICGKYSLSYRGINVRARTVTRGGCAISALIFVTALAALHIIMFAIRGSHVPG